MTAKRKAPPRGEHPLQLPRGAPTHLERNAKFLEEVCGYVRTGLRPSSAFAAAGAGRRTYFRWRERAERGEKPFVAVMAQIETAIAYCKADIVRRINQHGERSWQALSWIAERRHPEEFGRRDAQAVTDAVAKAHGQASTIVTLPWAAGMPLDEALAWAQRNLAVARTEREREGWSRIVKAVETTMAPLALEESNS